MRATVSQSNFVQYLREVRKTVAEHHRWHAVEITREFAGTDDDVRERANFCQTQFGDCALHQAPNEEWKFDPTRGPWVAFLDERRNMTFLFKHEHDAVLFKIARG